MRSSGIIILLSSFIGLIGCSHSETPSFVVPDGGNGSGGSTIGGTGGDQSGGTGGDGSGGTIGGGTGGTSGTGGSDMDAGNDAPGTGGASDDGGADAGTDGGDDGGAADGGGDDGGFPAGPIGSCNRFNWIVTASNSAAADPPGNAIDDVAGTRWSTGTAQVPGLFYNVDFAGYVRLTQIRLDNTGSTGDYPRGYSVINSPDNADFSNVIATGAGVGDTTTIDLPPTPVRYLRIQLTDSITPNWWSIHQLGFDCQISDGNGGFTTDVPADDLKCTPDPNGPAAGTGPFNRSLWTMTASDSSNMFGDAIANVVDGKATTRWSTGVPQTPGQYFKVDLGSTGCVSQLDMTSPGTDFPTLYEISVSTDDTKYVKIAKGVGIITDTLVKLPPHNARYVRIDQQGTSTSWWSINELTISP